MSRIRASDRMKKIRTKPTSITLWASLLAMLSLVAFTQNTAHAEQPPPPCHPNPNAAADRAAVTSRGDIVNLPQPLKDRLVQLADRPHTYLPMQAFDEADGASQLFQYYLLDTTGFEPNVFTTIIPGVNDGNVQLTVTGGELRATHDRRRARCAGAQARASDRSQRSARVQ
jgi:hypothetical protein